LSCLNVFSYGQSSFKYYGFTGYKAHLFILERCLSRCFPAGDASFVSAVPFSCITRKNTVTRTIINVAVINANPFLMTTSFYHMFRLQKPEILFNEYNIGISSLFVIFFDKLTLSPFFNSDGFIILLSLSIMLFLRRLISMSLPSTHICDCKS